jgi:hypothetical protein
MIQIVISCGLRFLNFPQAQTRFRVPYPEIIKFKHIFNEPQMALNVCLFHLKGKPDDAAGACVSAHLGGTRHN